MVRHQPLRRRRIGGWADRLEKLNGQEYCETWAVILFYLEVLTESSAGCVMDGA